MNSIWNASLVRRASLVCAVALTLALLWVSVFSYAGQEFAARHHRSSHLLSFALLAFSWRVALPRLPVWMLALGIGSLGFLQEFIEMFGHAHAFELNDAIIDSIGATVGAVLGDIALKRALPS